MKSDLVLVRIEDVATVGDREMDCERVQMCQNSEVESRYPHHWQGCQEVYSVKTKIPN